MHEHFMREALKEAEKAFEKKEIPIGAIIVKDDRIIGRGHNLRETSKDPTAHAEIIAIKEAAKELDGWRLIGCKMYVTVEPCPMCAGAIILSRIPEVYIGTMDTKGGAAGSVMNILEEKKFNHKVEVHKGVLQEECNEIITSFFKKLREEEK
ncbi:MAG: tRNA adenosine(34) deaminase TadA [Peptostreptococcales bacterium]